MPLYEHDCTNPGCCQFIGTLNLTDIYTHGHNNKTGPGILVRSSSTPWDYVSYPHGLTQHASIEVLSFILKSTFKEVPT